MKKIIIFILILLSFGTGFGASFLLFYGREKQNPENFDSAYARGWRDATDRLLGSFSSQSYDNKMEIKFLSGKINKISLNSVDVDIIKFDPQADADLDTRKVIIDNNTKIEKVVKKDNEEYQKELLDFKKKNNEGQDMPPSEFKKIEITSKDLTVGQNIQIWTNSDAKSKKEFIASEIVAEYQFK